MPMIRGFLGDRPVKTPANWGFEASRGGQAGASSPHRSLRSGFAPFSGNTGTCFREAGGGDGRGERSGNAVSSWFSGGQTC